MFRLSYWRLAQGLGLARQLYSTMFRHRKPSSRWAGPFHRAPLLIETKGLSIANKGEGGVEYNDENGENGMILVVVVTEWDDNDEDKSDDD